MRDLAHAFTYGSKCWSMYETFGRYLTRACPLATQDHYLKYVRGTLHIKEVIVDKVKNVRNDEKVQAQSESNVG